MTRWNIWKLVKWLYVIKENFNWQVTGMFGWIWFWGSQSLSSFLSQNQHGWRHVVINHRFWSFIDLMEHEKLLLLGISSIEKLMFYIFSRLNYVTNQVRLQQQFYLLSVNNWLQFRFPYLSFKYRKEDKFNADILMGIWMGIWWMCIFHQNL